jgi:hypothetical protein
VSENLTNPLLVADNFIMAGMFAALLVMAGSKFFRRHYPHPHSLQGDKEDVAALAAGIGNARRFRCSTLPKRWLSPLAWLPCQHW